MKQWLIGVWAVLTIFLVAACGAGGQEPPGNGEDAATEQLRGGDSFESKAFATATPAPYRGAAELDSTALSAPGVAGPAGTPAPSVEFTAGEGAAAKLGFLQVADRQVISSGSVSLEVDDVPAATTQTRVIAEGLGGYVEQLSSSGGPERQTSNLTVRVPQLQFFTAVERIEALGQVQARSLGSEDVSEQFVDLQARLQSAQREETSLLSLLEKTTSVSEILTIERELSRVRGDIERFQGQLNFLERRVALATLSVALYPPAEKFVEPPAAALRLEVADVTGNVAQTRSLVESLGGVVDGTLITVQDDRERASMTLRVFPQDFSQVVAGLERQGKTLNKEVREGGSPQPDLKAQGKDPTARVELILVEKVPFFEAGRVGALVAVVGGIAGLLAVLLLILLLVYRAGRRRGQRMAT